MDSKLTSAEKQYVKKYLDSVESLEAATWPEWAYTSILAFGGLLAIVSILATLKNISTENIMLMLVPSLLASVILLFFGASGLLVSRNKKEKMILSSVLKKLLA